VSYKIPHLVVVVPMLFLTAFLGLFVGTEYARFQSDSEMRSILTAPIPEAVKQLQDSVAKLEAAIAQPVSPENDGAMLITSMHHFYDQVLRDESVLTALYLNEALNAKESLLENDKLSDVRRELRKIDPLLPEIGASYEVASLVAAHAQMGRVIERVRDFRDTVDSIHKKEIEHLINDNLGFERRRALLTILVLISGFILVFSLLHSVCRYRENAGRAMAAERYNALFAAALHSTRVGVLIRDMQKSTTPVVFVNEAFTRMTGYALEDIAGDTSEFLFGWNTDAAAIMAFRRALSLKETATFDLLIYRKDGSPFWSEWHLSPVVNKAGTLTHFVSLFTDTTALRQTQEDLIQAKQLAQHASTIKTNFLAMMSHEIRTPINGILGVLKLVEETPLDSDQKHLINIAKTSSHALHGIINDILDYAKMEAGRIEIYNEPFSLPELLDGVSGLFQGLVKEKGIDLQFDIMPDIPAHLFGDVGRIRQIILNLVSNAIKFTDKGFVRLRVISLLSQEIDGEAGLLLRFEVQDTGLGISPSDQEKLFKEFSQIERSFTRRFGGTGLGLAISRRLVELLGGEISVESQSGKGSKFWFMIPIRIGVEPVVPVSDQQGAITSSISDSNQILHILLVEDNDTNRLVARRYLEKAGFFIEEAVNGVEAIEKAKVADFDLILMDVSMPEMDGMMATCHIRALGGKNAHVPVIALTAHVMTGDRELCLAAGMNDYLNKPLDYDMLLRTISRWLNKKGPEPVAVEKTRETRAPAAPASPTVSVGDSTPDIYEMPDFEPKILERMKQDLGGETVDQVTQTFLDDSAKRILMFEEVNRETVMDTAHTLKSCSANCGLMRFSKLMADLEMAATQYDTGAMTRLLGLVTETYRAARVRLEAEKGKYTA